MNNSKGLSIFVVDDDHIQTTILSTYLTKQGHNVKYTNDCNSVIDSIIKNTPQVILLDYRMEPLNGIQLCKLIRSATNIIYWPYIIFITAETNFAISYDAFSAGANDFICKPINPVELDGRLLSAKYTIEVINNHKKATEDVQQRVVSLEAVANQLTEQANIDPLTELYNRRYATTYLTREWSNLTRFNQTFSIISLDLDHFKVINDVYGHGVGDEVLKHFSKILLQTIRVIDVAIRMGGEEFIVVVSPTSVTNHVQLLGERIRQTIEEKQPLHLNLDHTITVSVGIATSDINLDNDANDTIKRSDIALYQSKHTGRNKVSLYNTTEL